MLRNLSRNTKIFLIVLHSVVILVLGLLAYTFYNTGDGYRSNLSYAYTKSLSDVTENIQNIENVLDKAKYVTTATGQMSLASQLKSYASSAKTAISYLPFSDNNSEKIESSLSLISDFAIYLERQIASGTKLTDQDYEAYEVLKEHASLINAEFYEIRERISGGESEISQVQSLISKSLSLPSLNDFDSNLPALSEKLSQIAAVEYDGAYYAMTSEKDAELLKGKEEIDEDEAIEIAAEFLELEEVQLSLQHTSEGALASYQIAGEGNSIKITVKGGEILYFKKTTEISDSKLNYEEALEKAYEHLNEAGYTDVKEVYYVISDNSCTINFVSDEGEVLNYLDLINVTVELGEGDMLEFDCSSYIMNHKERDEFTATLTKEEASKSISEALEIISVNLALIPSAGGNEILCYEFNTKDKEDGKPIKIYINAETGNEEQIYLVNESEKALFVS